MPFVWMQAYINKLHYSLKISVVDVKQNYISLTTNNILFT
jgi:hypothetical protein